MNFFLVFSLSGARCFAWWKTESLGGFLGSLQPDTILVVLVLCLLFCPLMSFEYLFLSIATGLFTRMLPIGDWQEWVHKFLTLQYVYFLHILICNYCNLQTFLDQNWPFCFQKLSPGILIKSGILFAQIQLIPLADLWQIWYSLWKPIRNLGPREYQVCHESTNGLSFQFGTNQFMIACFATSKC